MPCHFEKRMWFKQLRCSGILGINQRNADYTLRVNPRKFYLLVDDKLFTKQLAIKNGIKVPQLYQLIKYHHEIPTILNTADKYKKFVVKPAKGCAGEGILVIVGQKRENFEKANGQLISSGDLLHYISGILSGLYSLGGQDDHALVEYKVENLPIFDQIAYQGVPDIRIIIYLGVPVMAMLRLPTKESKGKANLHQGAVGVGIDLVTGITLQGVYHDRIVRYHPDTATPFTKILIPFWEEILWIASKAYDMTKLGYIGVDVVIDRDNGPMVLEFNARPGLSIQIANQCGLIPRLEAVEQHYKEGLKIEERILLGKKIAELTSKKQGNN